MVGKVFFRLRRYTFEIAIVIYKELNYCPRLRLYVHICFIQNPTVLHNFLIVNIMQY
jgi:hypothetical protein